MSKKIPTWRIEKNEHHHGDLFELIVTTTYLIHHKDIELPFYVFKGETEADYAGVAWKQTHETGVKSIEIMEDQCYLLVHYCFGESKKYPLREPFSDLVLTLDETEIIMPFFLSYKKKYARCGYIIAWQYDISISEKAVDGKKVIKSRAFNNLKHQLFLLGLERHQAKIILPKRASEKRGYTKEDLKDFTAFLENYHPQK